MKLQFSKKQEEKQYKYLSEVGGVTLYANTADDAIASASSSSYHASPNNIHNTETLIQSNTLAPQRMAF